MGERKMERETGAGERETGMGERKIERETGAGERERQGRKRSDRGEREKITSVVLQSTIVLQSGYLL